MEWPTMAHFLLMPVYTSAPHLTNCKHYVLHLHKNERLNRLGKLCLVSSFSPRDGPIVCRCVEAHCGTAREAPCVHSIRVQCCIAERFSER